MVRDPAERERRTASRGGDKCIEGIKRERGEECAERGGTGWVRCIPTLSLWSEGFWTCEGRAQRKVEARGGADVAFVCFPRFKASLEK